MRTARLCGPYICSDEVVEVMPSPQIGWGIVCTVRLGLMAAAGLWYANMDEADSAVRELWQRCQESPAFRHDVFEPVLATLRSAYKQQ